MFSLQLKSRPMHEPWFWHDHSLVGKTIRAALTPVSFLYDTAQRLRWSLTRPTPSPIPLICLGNATLGGVGKTPMAIAIAELFSQDQKKVCFLTRGYGGQLTGPHHVNPDTDEVSDIGDEALLLAAHAPVIKSANRRAGLDKIERLHPDYIIMDDGFQNPTVAKTLSIVLISPDSFSAPQHIFPAGPFREPLSRAMERAGIVICVGQKTKPDWADYAAWLEPDNPPPAQNVVAFSGIARPHRFYDMLSDHGFTIAAKFTFPDHHQLSANELAEIRKCAAIEQAAMMTTAKDFVRLAKSDREGIVPYRVKMVVDHPKDLYQTILSKAAPKTTDAP